MTLLGTQLVFVSETGRASNHDVTGSVVESVADIVETNFVSTTQEIWNDASGGNFTLSFEGETTGNLAWNVSPGDIELALEGFAGITDVAVTGSGTELAPWEVEFLEPSSLRVSLVATDSLTGGSTTINATGDPLPIDPTGLAYLGDNLLISDAEIEEEPSVYQNINLWEMTISTGVVNTGTTTAYSNEAAGLAYNGENQHLFVADDNAREILDVAPGGDGNYGSGNETVSSLDTTTLGIDDPQDVAWDPTTGQIFIAGGPQDASSSGTVTPVHLGGDGVIGGGDDVAGTVLDFSALVTDLIGLTYRIETDTLLLADGSGDERIVEVTKDGRLVRTIDIAFLPTPADLVIAPASPASDGVGPDSLYVVDPFHDNGEPGDNETPHQDGRLWELSVPFANLRPFVDAGPNESIDLGDPLTLTGDSYDDNQKLALGFEWTEFSGPGTVTFGSKNSLSTSVSFSAGGEYVLELESTDGDGLSNTDRVTVQVTDPNANEAPTVSAGSNQSITLPDSASLSGSASDDGLPDPPGSLTTTWSKVSGPGTVTFADSSALNTTASFSAAGTYTLRLTADDGGLETSDDVVITVNAQADTGSDSFIDDDDSIFEADIEWMAAEGITRGCNPPLNNLFCPDDFVTRGQMAAFLVRALDYTDGAGDDLFLDDDGNTFENDIDKLGTAGVTRGCNPPENDLYCPDDFVTRGQMAAFLVRALDYTDGAGDDLFLDDDGNTFENDIDKLGTAGVTRGCNPPVNNLYCPLDFVTRGQMAAFLHRALGR